MKHEINVEEPEIVLVSPADADRPCDPFCGPNCIPNCNPACMPNSIPCQPDLPCYPDIGRPPAPPSPGPN